MSTPDPAGPSCVQARGGSAAGGVRVVPPATIIVITGHGPAGCYDGFCIAAPHPPAAGHVDHTGYTWDDAAIRAVGGGD